MKHVFVGSLSYNGLSLLFLASSFCLLPRPSCDRSQPCINHIYITTRWAMHPLVVPLLVGNCV